MRKRFAILATFILAGLAFAGTLNNGNLSVELNGDGSVGALVYGPAPGTNHVSKCGLQLHYDAALHDTDYVSDSEKTYTAFPERQLFTGYGRDDASNFYIYSASYIEGNNTNLEQTLVIVMRNNTQVRFAHYLNTKVMQTETNDYGSFAEANQTLTFSEDGVFVGTVARLNGGKTKNHIFDGIAEVQAWLQSASVVNQEQQNFVNAAGAVAWDAAAVDGTPQVIRTKLMAASSDVGIQVMSDFGSATPVHVPLSVLVKKAAFVQKFLKNKKDKLKIKGSVDITEYESALGNMGSLDVSLLVGDYIGFTPDDGSEFKVKKTRRVHKLADSNGTRKLSLKTKKSKGSTYLHFSFAASKSDIQGATLLTEAAADGKSLAMMLPFTLVLTGSNSQDADKGGQVWIIADSIELLYDKQGLKKAKGKLK